MSLERTQIDHTDGLQNRGSQDEHFLLTEEDAVRILATGNMRERGLLPYSSNHSFLVTVAANHPQMRDRLNSDANSDINSRSASDESRRGEIVLPAVYKPQRGENPLWDFEWGSLCQRETAAYEISHSLGWQLVPPTVLRNGTRGLGSVQFYIDHDEDDHYFTTNADARFAPAFRKMALFDYVINNADRKSGHCLIGSDGHLWGIDHGVCLHTEFKLRTVIWEFSGVPIDKELMDDLMRFRAQLDDDTSETSRRLAPLLTPLERLALRQRVNDLIGAGKFPAPDPYRRNYPWPPI